MDTQDKAILYDDNCPMCQLYTQGFVRAGMLKPENRMAFSCLQDSAVAQQIDINRSRHEIPLIDLKGGKTLYGLDSLLFMIGCKLPFLARIARFAPFYFVFKYFYAFISYNRRVIVQAMPKPQSFDCAPDFHAGYRLAFIFLGCIASVYAFGVAWEYAGMGILLHYCLPFLGKHQRTELLGQLAVSFLLGAICVPWHFLLGIATLFISYAWRLKNFIYQNSYRISE